MTNDPIADMLTRIRNALMAGMPEVVIPSSKIKVEIARILTDEGYIDGYTVADEKPIPMISIKLKYFGSRRERRPVITSLQRISKPGAARLSRVAGYAPRDERHWHRHCHHTQRRYDRSGSASSPCGWRGVVLRLVKEGDRCLVLVTNPSLCPTR